MISIDTVYQRVLAITNKEQRGYVTPLEFNLIANQAQMLIFEQYFYDLDKTKKADSVLNVSMKSDMTELIKNKLADFTTVENIINGNTFPTNYRTGRIFANYREAKLAELNDILDMLDSTFHRAGLVKNPLYAESLYNGHDVRVFDGVSTSGVITNTTGSQVEIITIPAKVEWGYDVIAEKALYNANRSINFMLHASEETELVYKILELAGAVVVSPGIIQLADQEDLKKIQQEKQ